MRVLKTVLKEKLLSEEATLFTAYKHTVCERIEFLSSKEVVSLNIFYYVKSLL